MQQPTLIGWIGGGLVATLFAASRPEPNKESGPDRLGGPTRDHDESCEVIE
jgi:hypothetical protein